MAKRTDKYLPMLVEESLVENDRVNIYRWHDSPVELWAFNIGPRAPTRVDMRGLEHFPSQKQLEPALKLLTDWREQYRRESGDLAGPGRPRGKSPKTEDRLLALAQDYHETQEEYKQRRERPLTEKEFVEDRKDKYRNKGWWKNLSS